MSKHVELMERIDDWFCGRQGVVALFRAGSFASGTADAWSDLDYRVVVEDELYDRYLQQMTEAPANWGEVLFHEAPSFPNCCVSHFASFVKVDVFYYRLGEISPSPWYAQPVQIVYDPQGVVQAVVERSRAQMWPPGAEEISRAIGKGIAFAHECVRKWRRRDWIAAQDMLHGYRLQLIALDDLLGKRLQKGFARVADRSHPPFVAVLMQSFVACDAQQLRQQIERLTMLFRELVLRAHGMGATVADEQRDVTCLDMVLSELGICEEHASEGWPSAISAQKTVIINRAVPGSGKTTFTKSIIKELSARSLTTAVHSTDDYFMTADGKYDFQVAKLHEYHLYNFGCFLKSLKQRTDLVICDNVNLSPWQTEPYTQAAREHGYQVIFITFHPRELEKHVESQRVTPEKPDAHGVPEHKLVEFIEEYHVYSPLLSKENAINPNIHKRYRWDADLCKTVELEGQSEYFDLDVLISVEPTEYHDMKAKIGSVVLAHMVQ